MQCTLVALFGCVLAWNLKIFLVHPLKGSFIRVPGPQKAMNLGWPDRSPGIGGTSFDTNNYCITSLGDCFQTISFLTISIRHSVLPFKPTISWCKQIKTFKQKLLKIFVSSNGSYPLILRFVAAYIVSYMLVTMGALDFLLWPSLRSDGWKTTFLVKWSLFKGHVNFLGYVTLCHEFSEDCIVRETQRLPHKKSTSNEKVLPPMAWACLSV